MLGTVGPRLVSRTPRGFLFRVSSTYPITFSAMRIITTVVALLSGYLLARRASTVDRNMALHER